MSNAIIPLLKRGLAKVLLLPAALSLASFSAEPLQDIIVQIEGRVRSVGFADLNRDGLEDLLVMASNDRDSDGAAPLRVFFQKHNGAFKQTTIPKEFLENVSFLDVGNFARTRGKEILLIDGESVKVLNFNREREALLGEYPVSLKTLFYPSVHDYPHLLGLAVDLDMNGFDDAILPSPDGYALLLSRGDGSFEEPIYLPCLPEWSIHYSENSYFSIMTLANKLQVVKRPGRYPYLVAEIDGRLTFYEFRPEEEDFITMTSKDAHFGTYAEKAKEGTIEYSSVFFSEVEGRSIYLPRVLLSHRKGRAGILAELKTTHTVYDINPDRESGDLNIAPRQKIVTEGISGIPIFSDLNSDGHNDLVLLYVKTSFLTKLLEFLLDRVVITVQAHLYYPEKKRYSFVPDWTDDVSVPTQSFRVVGVEGLIRLDGDYSGDGRPDLMIFDSDRLLIKRGEEDSGLFSSKEVSFASRPFYQISGPFPGSIIVQNVDKDPRPEIISFGGDIVRVVHVR